MRFVIGTKPGYIDEAIYAWPLRDEIELGMEVMMRTLQGQGPRINQYWLVRQLRISVKLNKS